jgi:hypothetical protein
MDGYMTFTDQAGLRLALSRRLRDALLDGMRDDGASPAELEEASSLLVETAAALVDAMGVTLVDGQVLVKG